MDPRSKNRFSSWALPMGIRAFRLDCAQFHLNGLWISGGARRTSSHVRVLSEWDATDDDAQLCLRAVDTNHIVRRRPLCSFRSERHFARRLVPRRRGAYVESNIRPTQAKSHTDGRLHSGSWSFSLRCSGVNISLKVGTERVDLPHMLGRPSAIWHLKNEVQSALGTAHGRRCAG